MGKPIFSIFPPETPIHSIHLWQLVLKALLNRKSCWNVLSLVILKILWKKNDRKYYEINVSTIIILIGRSSTRLLLYFWLLFFMEYITFLAKKNQLFTERDHSKWIFNEQFHMKFWAKHFTQIRWVCRSQTKGRGSRLHLQCMKIKKLKCKYPMEQWNVLENKKKIRTGEENECI